MTLEQLESFIDGVGDDEMCDKCKVSSCLTLPHPCHYKQVKDNDDTLCNCCFLCEANCFDLGLELSAKSYGTK